VSREALKEAHDFYASFTRRHDLDVSVEVLELPAPTQGTAYF